MTSADEQGFFWHPCGCLSNPDRTALCVVHRPSPSCLLQPHDCDHNLAERADAATFKMDNSHPSKKKGLNVTAELHLGGEDVQISTVETAISNVRSHLETSVGAAKVARAAKISCRGVRNENRMQCDCFDTFLKMEGKQYSTVVERLRRLCDRSNKLFRAAFSKKVEHEEARTTFGRLVRCVAKGNGHGLTYIAIDEASTQDLTNGSERRDESLLELNVIDGDGKGKTYLPGYLFCKGTTFFLLHQTLKIHYGFYSEPSGKECFDKLIDWEDLLYSVSRRGEVYHESSQIAERQKSFRAYVEEFYVRTPLSMAMSYLGTESSFPGLVGVRNKAALSDDDKKKVNKFKKKIMKVKDVINVLDKPEVVAAKGSAGPAQFMRRYSGLLVGAFQKESEIRRHLSVFGRFVPDYSCWSAPSAGSSQVVTLEGNNLYEVWHSKLGRKAGWANRLLEDEENKSCCSADLTRVSDEFSQELDRLAEETVVRGRGAPIDSDRLSAGVHKKFFLLSEAHPTTGTATLDSKDPATLEYTSVFVLPLDEFGWYSQIFQPASQKEASCLPRQDVNGKGDLFHLRNGLYSMIWGEYPRRDGLKCSIDYSGKRAHLRLVVVCYIGTSAENSAVGLHQYHLAQDRYGTAVDDTDSSVRNFFDREINVARPSKVQVFNELRSTRERGKQPVRAPNTLPSNTACPQRWWPNICRFCFDNFITQAKAERKRTQTKTISGASPNVTIHTKCAAAHKASDEQTLGGEPRHENEIHLYNSSPVVTAATKQLLEEINNKSEELAKGNSSERKRTEAALDLNQKFCSGKKVLGRNAEGKVVPFDENESYEEILRRLSTGRRVVQRKLPVKAAIRTTPRRKNQSSDLSQSSNRVHSATTMENDANRKSQESVLENLQLAANEDDESSPPQFPSNSKQGTAQAQVEESLFSSGGGDNSKKRRRRVRATPGVDQQSLRKRPKRAASRQRHQVDSRASVSSHGVADSPPGAAVQHPPGDKNSAPKEKGGASASSKKPGDAECPTTVGRQREEPYEETQIGGAASRKRNHASMSESQVSREELVDVQNTIEPLVETVVTPSSVIFPLSKLTIRHSGTKEFKKQLNKKVTELHRHRNTDRFSDLISDLVADETSKSPPTKFLLENSDRLTYTRLTADEASVILRGYVESKLNIPRKSQKGDYQANSKMPARKRRSALAPIEGRFNEGL